MSVVTARKRGGSLRALSELMANCGGGEVGGRGAGNEGLCLPRVHDVRIDDRRRRIVGAEGENTERDEVTRNYVELN